MRKIAAILLVALLVLLVVVASCKPDKKPAEQAAPAATETAETSISDQARQMLAEAGYADLTVTESNGSLILNGEVQTPADRVEAGRSLAALNVRVINHLRNLTATAAPRPLSLYLEKRDGKVTARGHVTSELGQSLKKRYSLAANAQITEGPLSTENANEVVQLASRAINDMNTGFVRIAGSQLVVNGSVNTNPQMFRSALSRQLPDGFNLSSSVTAVATSEAAASTAETVGSASTEATNRSVESESNNSSPTRLNATKAAMPARTAAASTKNDIPIAETFPVDAKQVSSGVVANSSGSAAIINSYRQYASAESTAQTQSGASASALDELPIAETFPVEPGQYSNNAVFNDESNIPVAQTYSVPEYERSAGTAQIVYTDSGSLVTGRCNPANIELMPNGAIRFLHNSAKLTWNSRQRLEVVLPILNRCPELRLEIAGHTDVTGADGLNSDISQARAERIFRYLVDNGVAANRLKISSFGDRQPAHTNDTRFGRAMNRRVELIALPLSLRP